MLDDETHAHPLPASKPVTIMELTAATCRWPVRIDGRSEWHFCGQTVTRGRYCEPHAALAYRPPPLRPK